MCDTPSPPHSPFFALALFFAPPSFPDPPYRNHRFFYFYFYFSSGGIYTCTPTFSLPLSRALAPHLHSLSLVRSLSTSTAIEVHSLSRALSPHLNTTPPPLLGGWALEEWRPKPGLARHMGVARRMCSL